MAISNINYIVTKPTKGFDLVVDAPSDLVSQYDVNILNMSLQGFSNPVAVKCDFVLPDGTEINNVHLVSSIESPKKFSLNLGADILNSIEVGTENTFYIKNLSVSDLGYTYKSTEMFGIRMFRTDLPITYVPSDIDNLYILVNKLQEQIIAMLNK